MHLIADEITFIPIFIKFIQSKNLLSLIVIQIPIHPLPFKNRLLAVSLNGRVIIDNLLLRRPHGIQEIPDSMAEVAFLSTVHAQTTEEEATDLGLGWLDVDLDFLFRGFGLHSITIVIVKEYRVFCY